MDFKEIFFGMFASLFIVLRRFIFLIFRPYKTLRKISLEKDYWQLFFILFFVFVYFWLSSLVRNPAVHFIFIYLFFLINFFLTALFFFFMGRLSDKKLEVKSFIFTLAYSLLPTLLWFSTDLIFYYLLPPPRTISIMGRSFSIFFTAFSISLLAWKLILFYLAVRFSTRFNFYRTIYSMILYVCWFFPYSVFLYYLKLFRVPFI